MPSASSAHSPPGLERRLDLDWLRIAAFGILIFYHVGMFYVTWGFHVKSDHASQTIEPLMLLSNPWRLTLLFLISGCATRFMMDKMRAGDFLRSRSVRLIVPLVFGMLVIVPPQTYLEIVEKLHFSGSIGEFYGRYVTANGGWDIITPTWNHLWFVAYLFVYTLLVSAIAPVIRHLPAHRLAPLASGAAIVVLPWLVLTLARLVLEPIFPETHALVDDWYAHAVYFPAFLLGYAIAKHEPFFQTCERIRWPMLVLALTAWLTIAGTRYWGLSLGATPEPVLDIARPVLRELQAWTTILALLGFARKHLRRDSAVRKYLTDAIFPFYIVHQTAIVIAGHYLNKAGLPLWIEASSLIALTIASCWLAYELVRRSAILRPLFGLKVEPRHAIRRAHPAVTP